MSYLDNLLEDTQVNWLTIKDIIIDKFWIMPATPEFKDDEEIPYITSKNIRDGHINFVNVKFISYSDYLKLSLNRPILSGDILISMIGTIGEVAKVKDTDLDFYGQNMYLIRLNNDLINTDFFLHFFDSPKIKNHFHAVKNNSGQGYLKSIDIENLQIPIPCPDNPVKSLEIQKEIVRILDTFREHNTELTTELNKRRMQYKFYSTMLFDNIRESNLHSIVEVCHIEKGITPIQKAIPGKYPMVVTTAERKSCETYQFNAKAVCIPLVSSRGHGVASLNQVYYQEGQFALGNILCAIIPKNEEQVCSKYLYYYFQRTKEYTLVPLMKGGANVALRINDIEKVKVPIPPLEEQARIVSILDKFDRLTTSISEGLPKEVALRKKQYEYYRDLLLTFPKD